MAFNEDQVLDAVREYLAQLLPSDMRLLPADCRPAGIRDAEDVIDLAFTITQARFRPDNSEETLHVLADMDAVLAHASLRLARIEAYGGCAEIRTAKAFLDHTSPGELRTPPQKERAR